VASFRTHRHEDVQVKQDDRVTALDVIATNIGTWCSEVEAIVDDLKLEVQKIAKH
jgi:hypothetical protein